MMLAGRLGAGVAKNMASLTKGESLTKWSEIATPAVKKTQEISQAYRLSGDTIGRVTYSQWRNGPQFTFTSTDGTTTRLVLSSPDELALVKEVGGAKLAEHLENAVKTSADMPMEMTQTLRKGLDDLIRTDRAAAESLAQRLKVSVEELPENLNKIGKVMDKTMVCYVDESGRLVTDVFTSYNQLVYNYKVIPRGLPDDLLLNGLKSDLPNVKPTRLSGAHSETLGLHRGSEKFKNVAANKATDKTTTTPAYNIPDNAIVVKVVYGRPVCRQCLVNIPTQARNLGFSKVLLFEADSGKVMYWRSSMLDNLLLHMGKLDRSFDAKTIATKGSVIGAYHGLAPFRGPEANSQ